MAAVAAKQDDQGGERGPAPRLGAGHRRQAAALTAATLLAWLKLLAPDGTLARAEPKTPRRILHAAV